MTAEIDPGLSAQVSRCVCAVAFLTVLPALAHGQSLADAARKENDRRDKLRKAGVSSRTFTEEDLATTKGRVANDSREQAGTRWEGDAAKRTAAAKSQPAAIGPEGASSNESGRAETKEQYWRARFAEARDRVENVRARNDQFQRMIRLGQPAHYDANGRRVIYSIHQMKAMADAAAAELASAEAALENLLEEGRRAGALPGWLR